MKKVGVLRFPGTNCDRDVFQFAKTRNYQPEFLWHLDLFDIQDFECLIIPGGFSYGDYLRSGALAAKSPVMKSVSEFAKKGGPILGICNGFQILCESGLLPGALVKNSGCRFIDDWVYLKLEKNPYYFGTHISEELKKKMKLPIAHGDGRFYASETVLREIEEKELVWFRYEGENPNGSLNKIAGVMNSDRNVAGLMPHPERALFDWMGSSDGWGFL